MPTNNRNKEFEYSDSPKDPFKNKWKISKPS